MHLIKHVSLSMLLATALTAGAPSAGAELAEQTAAAPQTVVSRLVTDAATVAELSNGLTVIVKATRTSPVVTVKAYVKAGAMNEGKWLGCGLSHLLEHLVAKGAVHDGQGASEKKPEQTRDRVDEIGGQSNAYTTSGHTCYYISAAAGKTMDCVDLIADWMARPQITPEDFEREHGVVQRELEKGKEEPQRQAYYAYMKNVFGSHPAAVPTIGYAGPLAKVTVQDVLAYHKQMYVPQNMVFVVVGDVDVEAVLERTCKAFAGFDKARAPDLSVPAVKAFSGVRRITQTNKDVKDVMERISFPSIDLMDKDLYALDVLSTVMGAGKASRLHRRIQREAGLVTTISCSSWTPAWGNGAFTITFRCDPKKTSGAEDAVLAELARVNTPDGAVTADELARAQRQMVAQWVYSQQTADSIASTLASDLMSTGDVTFSRNYTKRVQEVTLDQIQAVARKYLTFDTMAVTRLTPPGTATQGQDVQSADKQKEVFFTLDNGLRVILQPADAGLVSMSYVVKGGLLTETAETNGLGSMMASLTTRGTSNYSAEEIDAFFAKAGGSISGSAGNNRLYWQSKVLADSFDEALVIFADVLCNPKFDKQEIEIIRPKILAAIKRNDEHWFSQLNKVFRQRFYLTSPFSMLTIGTEASVSAADSDAIRAYYRNCAGAQAQSPAVLAIYGRFDPDKTRKAVEKLFASLPAGSRPHLRTDVVREVDDKGELYVTKTDRKQAAVMVGSPGMKVDNLADRFAITVLDTIISGYRLPAGWMHTELRGKQLVYVVHSYNFMGLSDGAFITYAACQGDKAPEVVAIIRKNLRKASTYKPTQEEIDRAVNTILTAELLGSQKLSDLAMSSSLDELYGLGRDFRSKIEAHYRAVKPDDVLRVGKKYLSGGYVVVVTTPQPELFDGDSQAGISTEN